jgi:tetratricopeptide (TPR) repeat protein
MNSKRQILKPMVQAIPKENQFLEKNQQEFAELVTFVDFAERLTIGFVEINSAKDANALVQALRDRFDVQEVRFEVMNFSRDRDLRFLKDALVERLQRIELQPEQKLVLVLQGLEIAIGTDAVGDYPPILQDLNFVRDAYDQSVPHPLLFVLPDYAITRVAKYAPDFWAWKSGLFSFQSSPTYRQELQVEALERPLSNIASEDNADRIEQLKQLLMEYQPSGKPIALTAVPICSEIYYKLGSAYLTQREARKAIDYLQAGIKLLEHQPNQLLEQSLYRKLGNAYEQLRQFDVAQKNYKTALELAIELERADHRAIVLCDLGDIALAQRQFESAKDFYQQSLAIDFNDRYEQAGTYHQLGRVAQELREFDEARNNYQQALQINIEFNDRYSQASTYHQLGIVAQELREFDEARKNYQQALQIKIEFNDRYSQASTYHQLGRVAEELREFDEARNNYQQALQIYIEFNDRYSQASTYYQLGKVAEALGEIEEAIANYLLDLKITAEFNDQHGLGISIRNLARFYKTQPSPQFLTQISQGLGTSEAEVLQLFAAIPTE